MPDDYQQIFNWIKRGEDQQLDFKQHITNLNKIARTIVSFANTEGGLIVIGVDDQGDIVGVDPRQERFMMIKAGKQYCDPVVFIHFIELRAHKRNVLVCEIKKSKLQHRALGENGSWLPYTRVNDMSIVIPGLEDQLEADKYNLNPIPILMERNKGLIDYIEDNDSITIQEYMKLMNISYKIATRSLKELEVAGVLEEELINNVSYYYLKADGM